MTAEVNIIANSKQAFQVLNFNDTSGVDYSKLKGGHTYLKKYDVSKSDLITCHFTYNTVHTTKKHYSVFVDPERIEVNGALIDTLEKDISFGYPDLMADVVQRSHKDPSKYFFIKSDPYKQRIGQTGEYAIELASSLGYEIINLIGFSDRKVTYKIIERLGIKPKIRLFEFRSVPPGHHCIVKRGPILYDF